MCDSNYYKKIIRFMEYGAVGIILLSIVALIILVIITICHYCSTNSENVSITIEYVNSPICNEDSVGYLLTESQIDSLVNKLEYHEAVLNNKYNTIISQKIDEDFTRNLFLYVFGIVISVLGYFGYKSFKDVESRAIAIAEKNAKDTAQKIASTTAETIAKSEAEKETKAKCREYSDAAVKEYLNANLKKLVGDKVDQLYKREINDVRIAQIRKSVYEQLREELIGDIDSEIKNNNEGNGDTTTDEHTSYTEIINTDMTEDFIE